VRLGGGESSSTEREGKSGELKKIRRKRGETIEREISKKKIEKPGNRLGF
jgi:hypothetical protein